MDDSTVVLLLTLVGAVALAHFASRRGGRISGDDGAPLVVSTPANESVSAAVSRLAEQGFVLSHAGPTSATASRPKKPSGPVVLSLVLAVVPGVGVLPFGLVLLAVVALPAYLLYFAVARPRHGVSVVALEDANGTRLTVSGDDRKGRDDLARWARDSLGGS